MTKDPFSFRKGKDMPDFRREKSLYYHMKEMYEKKALTTWEWEAFLRLYNNYVKG